jgi:predicted regulator of Ras-like GTPase activity (Roadblock/LC7/MglB family)
MSFKANNKERLVFEEIFNKFHEKNNGIKAMGVWGKDGLELEKSFFTDVEDVDLEFSGAELADILSKLDSTRLAPQKYLLKINLSNGYLHLFSLTTYYFMVILSDEAALDGKLQFYIDLYKDQIIASL